MGGDQRSPSLETIRDVLSSFPAGVVIVTAIDAEDRPRGATVSAFCSVSLEPPLVLVCIARDSNTLPAISHSAAFTVNFLSAGREELALAFASKSEDKFSGVAWRHNPGAGPVLHDDAAAYLACEVEQVHEAGDHLVVIGHVADVDVTVSSPTLLYHRRTFSSVGYVGGAAL